LRRSPRAYPIKKHRSRLIRRILRHKAPGKRFCKQGRAQLARTCCGRFCSVPSVQYSRRYGVEFRYDPLLILEGRNGNSKLLDNLLINLVDAGRSSSGTFDLTTDSARIPYKPQEIRQDMQLINSSAYEGIRESDEIRLDSQKSSPTNT
jgi:hypothetical protein